ncbi:MAG: hypothetical protein LBT12_07345, partial [Oscillospiraceae bacterium]|nr:hypothetical protein [Oscillospiraceae bacterium]
MKHTLRGVVTAALAAALLFSLAVFSAAADSEAPGEEFLGFRVSAQVTDARRAYRLADIQIGEAASWDYSSVRVTCPPGLSLQYTPLPSGWSVSESVPGGAAFAIAEASPAAKAASVSDFLAALRFICAPDGA